MKPGDRRFVVEHRVVLIEASESHDDFKERSLRYVTLAETARLLHPNDVAGEIAKVATA